MPQTDVYDLEKNKVGTAELNPEIFDVPFKEDIVHRVVTWQLARRRSGTASTKTRGEVRGGGSKPWKQKGLGRARHGSIRSPLWRKGAVVFGPKPKDWSFDVPKKVRRHAMKSVLSRKLSEGKFYVVNNFDIESIKTKYVSELLKKFDIGRALLVDGENQNLYKSSRNIMGVKYIHTNGLNVYDILKYEYIVVSSESLDSIQEVYSS